MHKSQLVGSSTVRFIYDLFDTVRGFTTNVVY